MDQRREQSNRDVANFHSDTIQNRFEDSILFNLDIPNISNESEIEYFLSEDIEIDPTNEVEIPYSGNIQHENQVDLHARNVQNVNTDHNYSNRVS